MHPDVLNLHPAAVLALGRGFFLWVLLRSLVRVIGWPATIAIFVVVIVVSTFIRQRRR